MPPPTSSPRSYAAGGYYGTPVERLLPVDMNVKTEVAIPSLSVVFVLDRSGSMGTKVQDEDKLAIKTGLGIKKARALKQGAEQFMQREWKQLEAARKAAAAQKPEGASA